MNILAALAVGGGLGSGNRTSVLVKTEKACVRANMGTEGYEDGDMEMKVVTRSEEPTTAGQGHKEDETPAIASESVLTMG